MKRGHPRHLLERKRNDVRHLGVHTSHSNKYQIEAQNYYCTKLLDFQDNNNRNKKYIEINYRIFTVQSTKLLENSFHPDEDENYGMSMTVNVIFQNATRFPQISNAKICLPEYNEIICIENYLLLFFSLALSLSLIIELCSFGIVANTLVSLQCNYNLGLVTT